MQCGSLAELLKPMTRPPGFANTKPLCTQQHGALLLDNILIDLRNTLWLVDVSKSTRTEPFTDAATMCVTLASLPSDPRAIDCHAVALGATLDLPHAIRFRQRIGPQVRHAPSTAIRLPSIARPRLPAMALRCATLLVRHFTLNCP